MKRYACCLVLLTALVAAGCSASRPGLVGGGVYNVLDYGAVADGATKCTKAIATAIAAAADAGGGTVLIPAGTYLTGPIHLKSGVTLHTEEGTLVRFSDVFDDYPTVATRNEGIVCFGYSPLIYANGQRDVAVTGKGTFDGQGQAWWGRFRTLERGKVEGPTTPREREFHRLNVTPERPMPDDVFTGYRTQFLRPPLIQFYECKGATLDGPTFVNSPFWTVHPVFTDDLTIRNVTVRGPADSPNTDGLDIDSCRRVLVEGCTFTTGDDCICVKSGKNADGRRAARPTEDVVIRDCTGFNGHGGIVIGSEMSGDIRRVVAENCRFIGTDRGIRIKTRRGRGGVVESCRFSNIEMEGIRAEAVVVNSYYFTKPTDTIPPVTEETPRIRDIRIERVRSRNGNRAISLRGLPEMPLSGIEISECEFEGRAGIACRDASRAVLRDVKLRTDGTPALALRDVNGVKLDRVEVDGGGVVAVRGAGTSGIEVSRSNVRVELSTEVPADAVKTRP